MTYNAGIILQGQQPDLVNTLARATQAAGLANQNQQRNALAQTMQQHGAGILAGDRNALNALAGHDPAAALGITQTQQQMRHSDERLQMLRQQAARQAEAHAASLSAQQREEYRAKLSEGLAGAANFYSRGDEGGYNRWLTENGIDPAEYPFPDFPAHAARFGGVMDALEAFDERNAPADRNVTVGAQEILEDGTIVQSTSAGPRVYLPTGEVAEGQAAADAIRAAREQQVANQRAIFAARREGTLNSDIALGGEAAAVKDIAEGTVEAGFNAWEDYGKIQSSLSNIETAIRAIDEGAESGVVYNMLPSITLASASLDNAMNRMGLDVIGAVTFGALSEGEMRLAMETAVPRNLQPEQLREWLVRRAEAQQKAAAMLADAAQYLTTPGNTIHGWIERNQTENKPVDLGEFSEMTLEQLGEIDVPSLTSDQMEAMEQRFIELGIDP